MSGRVVSTRRAVALLTGDVLAGLERVGRERGGAVARVHLGPVRPYLVTHPDHVGHVLANRDEVYRREGMLWRPIQRLEGHGIAGEGLRWRTSRRILQPLLTKHKTRTLAPVIAQGVAEALDRLARRAGDRMPVDVLPEMMRVTHRVLIRAFFGDRIDERDADRLGRAINAAFESLGSRMLLPFVPGWMPMPGDRVFRRATRVADEVIYRLIRGADGGDDLVTHFVNATDEDGKPLGDKRVRDDLVAMFVAGTETTALLMTWLWVLQHAHPEVAAQLSTEAAQVIGDGSPQEEHLTKLVYTRMVLQEVLRLYPIGWLLPRRLAADDVIDGVRLRAGSTVLLSPYVTHRLPDFWAQPHMFNPQRFAEGTSIAKHSYLPFGAGEHNCLGRHFSLSEATLAVAGLLARFQPEIIGPQSLVARPTASLRPKQAARMLLHPRR